MNGPARKPVATFTRTVEIFASSRASVKVKETFYTFEYSEKRSVDLPYNMDESALDDAKANLWLTVHAQVDKQVEEVFSMK